MNWFRYIWMVMLGVPYIFWVLFAITDTMHYLFFDITDYVDKEFEQYVYNKGVSIATKAFWILHIIGLFIASLTCYIIF